MKLEIKDLHKSFGNKEVLHGISFSVESGHAFGLLGRNGAGKTTIIRILIDLFKADQGEILMDGSPFCIKNSRVGYLPEERGLYPKKRVNEQLIYLAELRGIKRKDAQIATRYWLKKLNIIEYEFSSLESLSKGNQQKVQLIQAIICNPDIVILDEPFSGLDPVNSKLLQEVVRELVRNKKLVIFSSHQMNYVEDFCEEVAILKEGTIVLQGKLSELKEKFGANRILVKADNLSVSQLECLCFHKLQEFVGVYDCKEDGIILELRQEHTKSELLSALIEEGIEIAEFGIYRPSLTDIFVLKAGD